MPFSAALGLAGSALGMIGSFGAANAAAEASMYAAQQRRLTEERMMGLASQQMGIGMDLLGREDSFSNYVFGQNAYNQGMALDQRNYGRSLIEQDRARLVQERNAQIARVQELDYAAATEYERRLAALRANSTITREERERAIAEMEQAQQIAQRERQQQIAWLEEDRARAERERQEALDYLNMNRQQAMAERGFDIDQLIRGQNVASSERQQALGYLEDSRSRAQQERDFDIAQYSRAADQARSEREFQETEYRAQRAQAMSERMFDMARRNQLDEATNRYGSALQAIYDQLGPVREVNYLGEPEIAAESARRERTAVDDVNSVIDRVASVNEARLINQGVDSSTRATSERGDIAARMSEEMARARDAARSEAIRYVAGINDQLRLGADQDASRRSLALNEISGIYGAPIEMLMRSPDVASALGGPSFNQVGSAVYDRAIASANDYRSPLDIGSANYNSSVRTANSYDSPLSINSTVLGRNFGSANDYRLPINVGSAAYGGLEGDLGYGMSTIADYRSATGAGPYDYAGTYAFSMPSVTNAGSLFSSASGLLGNVLSSQGNAEAAAAARAESAAYGAGQSFTDFFRNAGSFIDQSGWFGGGNNSSAPAISIAPAGYTPPLTSGGGFGWM